MGWSVKVLKPKKDWFSTRCHGCKMKLKMMHRIEIVVSSKGSQQFPSNFKPGNIEGLIIKVESKDEPLIGFPWEDFTKLRLLAYKGNDSIDISFLKLLPSVTCLEIRGGILSQLSGLEYGINLTCLHTEHVEEIHHGLEYCDKLHSLNIDSDVTGVQVPVLNQLIPLTKLTICHRGTFDFDILKNLVNLKELWIQSNHAVNLNIFGADTTLCNLKELVIHTNTEEELLIDSCPSLNSIDISGSYSSVTIRSMKIWVRLESLHTKTIHLMDLKKSCELLTDILGLEKCWIDNCAFYTIFLTVDNVKEYRLKPDIRIENCPELNFLSIVGDALVPLQRLLIQNCPVMNRCYLKNIKIPRLSDIKVSLKSLDMKRNLLTSLKGLDFTRMEELNISQNPILTIGELAKCKLKSFKAVGCDLIDLTPLHNSIKTLKNIALYKGYVCQIDTFKSLVKREGIKWYDDVSGTGFERYDSSYEMESDGDDE